MYPNCAACKQPYVQSRRGHRYCSTKCRVAAQRKKARTAKQDRKELADFGTEARAAIYSIIGIGQTPADQLRARGTLKQVWIVASEGLLELGVTREVLRELLIK